MGTIHQPLDQTLHLVSSGWAAPLNMYHMHYRYNDRVAESRELGVANYPDVLLVSIYESPFYSH
jgi:hypothetical protein